MTDGNTTIESLPDPASLQRQIAALTERLAEYEKDRIARPAFSGEAPRYRLNGACYLEDDTLHVEGEELEYLGTPNLEMVPLNEPAKRKMQAHLDDLTQGARAKAEMAGRPFLGLVTDKGSLIAQAMQDERRMVDKVAVVSMPEDKGKVPVMPHLPDAQAQTKRRGRAAKGSVVMNVKAPPPPGKAEAKPMSVIGREYSHDAQRGTVG